MDYMKWYSTTANKQERLERVARKRIAEGGHDELLWKNMNRLYSLHGRVLTNADYDREVEREYGAAFERVDTVIPLEVRQMQVARFDMAWSKRRSLLHSLISEVGFRIRIRIRAYYSRISIF